MRRELQTVVYPGQNIAEYSLVALVSTISDLFKTNTQVADA